jgi:hypothetical protein
VACSKYDDLLRHVGHRVVVVSYGPGHEYGGDVENVAVECETCGEVLLDFDHPNDEASDGQ